MRIFYTAKRNTEELLFSLFNTLLLVLLMVITIYPLLHVIFGSFSDSGKLIAHSGLLLRPLGFTLEAYKMVFRHPMILKGYMNTLFLVAAGTTVNIFMTALGAYFLSRKGVLWQKAVMMFIVFTMFFRGGLIPLFLIVRAYGLYNSLWALILTFSINTFYLIIMRTGFMAIPDSLEESARIDGANHLTILFRIILPTAKAILAVMILYYGVDRWNGWFYARIFLKSRDLYPIQLILREILILSDTASMTAGAGDEIPIDEALRYGTVVIATIPILLIYPFLQKYFVKGALIGSVKG